MCGYVVDIFKRLIHAWVESTDAQVLVVVEAVEERKVRLNVVVDAPEILPFRKRCVERTGQPIEVAAELNWILKTLVRAFEVSVKEKLVLPDRPTEVRPKLFSTKSQGGLRRCDGCDARRSLVA